MGTPSTNMAGAIASVEKALAARPRSRTLTSVNAERATVTVTLSAYELQIARAIGLSMTQHNDPKEPAFTLGEVLEHMLLEGLISREKRELGTRSLDHSIRGDDGDRLPKSTRKMLKLVKTANESAEQ